MKNYQLLIVWRGREAREATVFCSQDDKTAADDFVFWVNRTTGRFPGRLTFAGLRPFHIGPMGPSGIVMSDTSDAIVEWTSLGGFQLPEPPEPETYRSDRDIFLSGDPLDSATFVNSN